MKSLCLPLAALAVFTVPLATVQRARAETVQELKEREVKVRKVAEKVMPSIVAITSADPKKPGSGSGVIVQKDGLILTAAHVTAATGDDLIIVFPDGRRVKGKALGANRTTDAGMAKITDEGEWPAAEMGSSDKMRSGDWCIAMGHPGGFSYERRPPVRLGRIWNRELDGAIFADGPLIGGDSGGPLFDLEGRVIGINSSIHGDTDRNRHVAIDTLREDWDRMLKEKAWGRQGYSASPNRPRMGVVFDRDSQEGVKVIDDVDAESPAGKAGVKNGDVLVRFDGVNVATFHHLQRLIGKKSPGDKVKMVLNRGKETVECEIELGKPASQASRTEKPKEKEKEAPKEDRPKDPSKEEEEPKEKPEPRAPKLAGDDAPRPYFGATVEDAGDGKGARVTEVKADSPAAKAGLAVGDIIVGLNDKAVGGLTAASDVFRGLKPGDKVTIKSRRGDKELSAEATLEKK